MGCVVFSRLLPNRKELKLQTETCCSGMKATTLFCSLHGPGVKRLLSKGTGSRNGLAPCKAPCKAWVQRAVGFEAPPAVPQQHPWGRLGVQKLCKLPSSFSLHLCGGLPCSPCLRGPAHLSGSQAAPAGISGAGNVYHLWQGGEFPVTLLRLHIPGQLAKGAVGRLIGVSFPACDCWSGRGEIKSSSPAAVRIPGLIFIS